MRQVRVLKQHSLSWSGKPGHFPFQRRLLAGFPPLPFPDREVFPFTKGAEKTFTYIVHMHESRIHIHTQFTYIHSSHTWYYLTDFKCQWSSIVSVVLLDRFQVSMVPYSVSGTIKGTEKTFTYIVHMHKSRIHIHTQFTYTQCQRCYTECN